MNKEKQLEKLKAAIELVEQGSPSQEEVVELFTALVTVVKDISKGHAQNVAQLNDKLKLIEASLLNELGSLSKEIPSKIGMVSKKSTADTVKVIGLIRKEVKRLENLILEKNYTLAPESTPYSPTQLRDKLASLTGDNRLRTTAIRGLEVLDELPDIKRMAQANANAQSVPVTTTFFYKNGSVIGRAKNINFVEGNNVTFNVYQTGDQINVSVSTVSASGTFATEEVPSGTIDGTNKIFTLAHTPIAGSVKLYLNGARQQSGGGDYSISGSTVTFTTAPQTGSILLADYQY